jgi:hypothetical protein
MQPSKTIDRLAKRFLPPPAARWAKRPAVQVRFWAQARKARSAFRRCGHLYPQKVLFIAGLPKSGTTWLEQMICSYPGFQPILIPDITAHEMKTGGSDDYELPGDMFDRFAEMLVLTKVHVRASAHNVEVLRKAGVRYVVLYRDLRDVAVSYYYYVRSTPWHPECAAYAGLGAPEGLLRFAATRLAAYANWVRAWHRRRDPAMSVELTYEQMLADPAAALRATARLFQLDASPGTISRIVEANRFGDRRDGRDRRPGIDTSFFRVAVAGDWRNHFTREVTARFKDVIGDFLVEFGYEKDCAW